MNINYYEIVISTYHGEHVGRLRYLGEDGIVESALYSIPKLNNLLVLWRADELAGSFGIRAKLAPDARFQIVTQ